MLTRTVHFDFRFISQHPKDDYGHVILQRGDSVSFSYPSGAIMANDDTAPWMGYGRFLYLFVQIV